MFNYIRFSKERFTKIILYMIVDAVFVDFSLLAGISLWYDGSIPGAKISTGIPPEAFLTFYSVALVAPIICIITYACFRFYNNLWKYASIDEIFKIFLATIITTLCMYAYSALILVPQGFIPLGRRIYFVAWFLNFTMFAFSRFGYRAVKRFIILASHTLSSKAGCKRVMIVGAGFAGYGVIRGMIHSQIRDSIPALVVDSDGAKHNTSLMGVRVLGTQNIQELVEKYQIDEIVIAMPDAPPQEMKLIMEQCTATDCGLKIVPPISDVDGSKSSLRDVSITDLLFRDEIKLDTKNISGYLNGRVILVTGGGGSIGSELCRQIAKFGPKLLIIFDIYENNAFLLASEFKAIYGNGLNIELRIGSVRDAKRVEEIFKEFSPHVIFHAAAHKHVHLMEEAPAEAVKNNIFGTYNVAKAADKFGAERFVLLSTDKAVNPTNIMGATKRVTEIVIQSMAAKSKTKYMAVRFGNVLGSGGSVIPLFQMQIQKGGPVTVTDPNIERFFMTIPEAAQLVLQAASLGKSGRIFVLDMGSPVKINDLARNLIRLSGFKPDVDIKIVYTGLRPGEKLYEELIMDEEKDSMQITAHKKIFMTKPIETDYTQFENDLKVLYEAAHNHPEKVDELLHKMVPNFSSLSLTNEIKNNSL